jgi:ribosomal protein L37AE/L43A
MFQCVMCGDDVDVKRVGIGYKTCLWCGEEQARAVKHTIVPMPKSNYIVVSDVSLLLGLNSSHKGGSR